MNICNTKSYDGGLFLCGTIAERFRRSIGQNNTELVTYKITDGFFTYFVNHWNPENYYEVNSKVCIPVIIKPYIKNGNANLSYVVKHSRIIGEEF